MHTLNEHIHQYIDSSDALYLNDADLALRDRKEIKKKLASDFKDVDKTRNEFININHKREYETMKTKEFKKMHLDESLFDGAVLDAPTEDDTLYYSAKRGSLFDLISMYLTDGEVAYLKRKDKNGNDKYNPTRRGGLGLDNGDITVDYGDENGRPSITVRVTDEQMANRVKEIADRFDKTSNIKPCRFYGDKKFQVVIYIDDEDFDGNYQEDGVQVRSDNRGKSKSLATV